MTSKDAGDVARRCLCLELLFQRFVLETDAEDPIADRESAREMWLSRRADLGIGGAFLEDEIALLERPVGSLSEDELDDVHGRATGALILLWSIGRLGPRPTFATVNTIDVALADHGLLGDGSVTRARAASETALLRPAVELDAALASYVRTRGKAREVTDPDRIFAEVAAHHLTWILDREMPFEEDVALE